MKYVAFYCTGLVVGMFLFPVSAVASIGVGVVVGIAASYVEHIYG